MRPDIIVFLEPGIDHNLRLFDVVEPFGSQNFLAKNSVESFIVAVFPRATWIDLDRFDANLFKPILKLLALEKHIPPCVQLRWDYGAPLRGIGQILFAVQ